MIKKYKIPFLFLFVFFITPTFAQRITRVDSVVLFQIGTDYNDIDNGILRTKGTVTELRPDSLGGFVISVFKQYNGHLVLDPSVRRKGLVSGNTVLPGLAQLYYDEAGLRVLKEKTFSLNTGLKFPFKYRFLEATGALNKTQSKITENVLGSDELGGDYHKLRETFPEAVAYEGDVVYHRFIDLARNNKTVEYSRIPVAYVPFMASYDLQNMGPEVKKTFEIKGNPKGTVYFRHGLKLIYLATPADDHIQVMCVDTMGIETPADKIIKQKGMEVHRIQEAYAEAPGAWISNRGSRVWAGADLLLTNAFTDRKNGRDFALVRLDQEGKVLYNHTFNVAFEDYLLQEARVFSGGEESLVQVTLRKGVTKYQTYYIKIRREGLVYKTASERVTSKKEFTADGRSLEGGCNEDQQLTSLPDGGNVIWGYSSGIFSANNGKLLSYGALHLNKDGVRLAHYNAAPRVPESALLKRPSLASFALADGRMVMVVNEPRDQAGQVFQQFSLLDAELYKDYAVKKEELEPGKLNILYRSNPPGRSGTPSSSGTGIKFLDKVTDAAAATGLSGLRSDPVPDKKRQQMEGDPVGYVPSLLIIDFRQEKITRLDLKQQNGYSLYNKPVVWINRESGEAVVFVRTPPVSAKTGRGIPKYPTNVYLKTIRIKL